MDPTQSGTRDLELRVKIMPENGLSNNRVIAKNTIFMYLRMGVALLVGLYTSRVVLRVLGVEDYGLYNVIGGIVAIFTVLNSALVNTTSRFVTVSLAKDDPQETRHIFNMTFLMHFFVGLFIVIIGETVGLWYLHHKLVIPEGREEAAEWLYQFTVVAAFINTINVPYYAAMIAHEKINIYAILQIVGTFLTLGVVLALPYVLFDKLIFYAISVLLINASNFIVGFIYCHNKFQEVRFVFYWDWRVFKEILKFVGWALVGNFSYMFYTQGINLLLNAFCGPAVNAARGIAVQVQGVVAQMANNVQTAINPQIIKSYSTDNLERMHLLICASSRFCYYLLFLIALPIMLETDYILHLWLEIVPEHAANFIRLTLVAVLLDAFINPMFTANLASGKLNLYYIPVSIVSFSFMFITYYAIKHTRIPESVFICYLTTIVIGVVIRIFVMKKQVQLSPAVYVRTAILPAAVVTLSSAFLPFLVHYFVPGLFLRLVFTTLASMASVAIAAYTIGITSSERQFVNAFLKQKFSKVIH